jgi:hypothetical protein
MSSFPTAQNAAEHFFDVDIPLEGTTKSAANVAQLVSGLLYTVDALADDVAHTDVLQALAIATAVRKAMADVSSKHGHDIPLKLLDAKVATADFGVARAA